MNFCSIIGFTIQAFKFGIRDFKERNSLGGSEVKRIFGISFPIELAANSSIISIPLNLGIFKSMIKRDIFLPYFLTNSIPSRPSTASMNWKFEFARWDIMALRIGSASSTIAMNFSFISTYFHHQGL